jgi:hypothetical protein
MSVRLELNDEIRDALRIPPEEQEGRLRRELALRLYEKGLLSLTSNTGCNGGKMRKVRIEYDSRVDALVAVSKRLSAYEGRNKIESEVFFDRFVKGQTEDSEEFVEWANDYQHYLALRQQVEAKVRHAG